MSSTTEAWSEVGTKFNALALKLQLHYQQAQNEEEAEQERAALKKLADALDAAFEAVGSSVKDPAVKGDVKDVGVSFAKALTTTVTEATDKLRKTLK